MFDVLLLLLLIIGLASASGHWTYQDVYFWPGYCTRGIHQSPIDLDKNMAKLKEFEPFNFKNYDKSYKAVITNNKHTVEVMLKGSPQPSITGASLPGEFILDQFHFHWKSEHTMNGERFPLEVHFVHHDSTFANLSQAINNARGVAVLSFLFNIAPNDDHFLKPFIAEFGNIAESPNKQIGLSKPLSLRELSTWGNAGFYRYAGSLTTPDCNEAVIWTVFTELIAISKEQAVMFQMMKGDWGLLYRNYRPIQNLNGRYLYLKKNPNKPMSNSGNSITLSVGLAIVSLMVLVL